MTTSKKLGRVVGVSEKQAAELDPRYFLGRLVLFTLPDRPVSGSKLLRLWGHAGLDLDLLPDARQPVHVFQSACASVKQRRGTNGHNNGRTEIAADEVQNNGGAGGDCVYQITVKVWDTAARTVEFEKALRATFDKRTSEIAFDHLGSSDPRLAKIEREIRRYFDQNGKTLPGNKVRNGVRDQLAAVGAQNVRRKAGGAYFVPMEWKPNGQPKPTGPILDGLKGVIEELYGGDGDFYTVPLANDLEMRAMVAKHFTLNARENLQELTLRALDRARRKGNKVRQDMLANMWNERRQVVGAIQQFEELVDLEKKDIEAELHALDQALTELQDQKDAD